MHYRAPIVVALVTVAAGCSKQSPGEAAPPDVVQSVCSLPAAHNTSDGKRVLMRGRFDVHAHGVFIGDKHCPDIMLALKQMDGGPDITFCNSERLMQEFGCPGGNHNGPIVTVVGILNPSKTPEVGSIVVSEMWDFENVRTGERFTP